MSRKESKTSKVFDKMVGFGSSNKSRGKYPPGQLQRPSSVGKSDIAPIKNPHI